MASKTAEELCCNTIAKLVHSKHKCNQQNCLKKGNGIQLISLSTRNKDDIEYCLALLHIKKKSPVKNRRVTSCSATEIEQEFGTYKFEVCLNMMKTIQFCLEEEKTNTSSSRRSNEDILNNYYCQPVTEEKTQRN